MRQGLPTVLPAAFELAGVHLHTYTGWGTRRNDREQEKNDVIEFLKSL